MRCGCRSASQARRVRDVRSFRSLCGPQGTRKETLRVGGTERRPPVSGHGGRGTPGPIPNPEAKPPSADGTAVSTVGEQGAADRWTALSLFTGLARGGAAGDPRGAPSFRIWGLSAPFRVSGPARALRVPSPVPRPEFSGRCGLFFRLGLPVCFVGFGRGLSYHRETFSYGIERTPYEILWHRRFSR